VALQAQLVTEQRAGRVIWGQQVQQEVQEVQEALHTQEEPSASTLRPLQVYGRRRAPRMRLEVMAVRVRMAVQVGLVVREQTGMLAEQRGQVDQERRDLLAASWGITHQVLFRQDLTLRSPRRQPVENQVMVVQAAPVGAPLRGVLAARILLVLLVQRVGW
jgi:hypothetical protein